MSSLLPAASEVISVANEFVFELGEDEGGFPDVSDLVGAGGDVLEYGPAGFQKGEASLSLGP